MTSFETAGKPAVITFGTRALHSGHVRVIGSVLPHGYTTQYDFEYETDKAFNEGQWDTAQRTPVADAGIGAFDSVSGFPTSIVGQDLPNLTAGAKYRYRLVAINKDGEAVGGEQQFIAPQASGETTGSCPNDQLRTGLSAKLPECRAYEQVTPTEKGGTMDIGTYGNVVDEVLVGGEGDHLFLHAPGTQWGPSPDSKISGYVFTRTPSGWETTSVTPQPEAGGYSYTPTLFSPDMTEVGLEVGWRTTPQNASPNIELKYGRPGGPYALVAAIPRGDASANGMWAAASANGKKLVIRTLDHELAGNFTGTAAKKEDLYELSEGKIAQLNVLSDGEKIGTCGASIVHGYEGFQEEGEPVESSSHAVSADGSRVFFEETPGTMCTSAPHLFMRLDGTETLDIGVYRFLAANSEGTDILLEEPGPVGQHQLVLDDLSRNLLKPLVKIGGGSEVGLSQEFVVSEDLTDFYFRSPEQLTSDAPPLSPDSKFLGPAPENLYRYDIANSELTFVAQAGGASEKGGGYSVSPNGEFFYFVSSGLGGVPGGAQNSNQVYRYDGVEGTLVCMSCASASNPEPKLGAYFLYGKLVRGNGVPNMNVASSNGNVVFFDSASELVPQDVDGEIPPDPTLGSEHVEFDRSPSSDTYEWRASGIAGCTAVQGCLSLISSGTGGYRNELLGATPSGSDVFFITHEPMVLTDTDAAGDIYDARVDGGIPGPAAQLTECENSACSTPVPLPIDNTPSSFTFIGTETPIPFTKRPSETVAKAKKKKLASCKRVKRGGKCVGANKKVKRSTARKTRRKVSK